MIYILSTRPGRTNMWWRVYDECVACGGKGGRTFWEASGDELWEPCWKCNGAELVQVGWVM